MRVQINLKEIQDAIIIAKNQKRSLLGVIYNDYLRVPNLDCKKVKVSTNTINYLLEKEKEIDSSNMQTTYLLYGPSVADTINLKLNEFILSI